MKIAFNYFIIIFFLLFSYSGKAQSWYDVVSGSSYDYSMVFNEYYNYSFVEYIYPQSYIGQAGSISQIQFEHTANSTTTDLITIYMGHTTKSAFLTTSDWITTGLTQVYSGSITTASGWYTITLSTPFVYNNSDNLVILIDNNDGSYTGTSSHEHYYNAAEPGNYCIYQYSDVTNNDLPTPSTSGTMAMYLANLKLYISGGGGGYCAASGGNDEYISQVTVGTINNATTYSAGGYGDYTYLSTDMGIGGGYGITVTNGSPYASDQCGIWVDWNQDMDFNDANETITVTGTPGTGPYTATIIPPAGATLGNTRMRVRIMYTGTLDPCGATSYGEVEDYTVNVTVATPMTYSSSTVTQNNTDDVYTSESNAEIICIQVVTTGSTSPIDITQFRLQTTGSTDPVNDISNARIWFTGTSSIFATTTLFGTYASPPATGTNYFINGTQTLASGTNYFWLTYDIDADAPDSNVVDGLCNRITVNAANYTPTVTDPAGNRIIIKAFFMDDAEHYTCTGKFFDTGGKNNNYSDSEDYTITFNSDDGDAIQFTFFGFETQAGVDYLYAYDGPNTGSPLLASLNGTYAYPPRVTSTGTSMTFRFVSDGATNSSGWDASILCTPTCGDNPLAIDDCGTTANVCNLDGYCGNTSGLYTADYPGNLCDGCTLFDGAIHNSSWLTFQAADTTVTIEVDVYNCTGGITANTGIQMGIYEATSCDNFVLRSDIAYTEGSFCPIPAGTQASITADSLTPGDTYYIMVDGCGGDVCDYSIESENAFWVPEAGTDEDICFGGNVQLNATGGTSYSWTPATGLSDPNIANPVASPTVTTTYTVDIGSVLCPAEDSLVVYVHDIPVASFTGLGDEYCLDDAPVTLTGNHAPDGSFSGSGITDNGDGTASFDPAAAGAGGPYNITYTYIDGYSCEDDSTETVIVHALPTVNFSGLSTDICIDAGTSALTGNHAPNGTFSGTGITDHGDGTADFDPSTAGIGGPYNITYTYTDGNGCTNSEIQNVTVHNTPTVNFSGLSSDYCIDAGSATLTGNHAPSGTFSGNGITDNGDGTASFDPATAGSGGPYNITYSYTDGNGCEDSETLNATVHDLPTVNFSGLDAEYCVDATPVTLTGNNAPDGSFSGSGITDNADGTAEFNPSSAGTGGPYSITYTYTDGNGCTDSETQNVTVNDLPVVTFNALPDICSNADPYTLTEGNPGGGSYSGTGVSGGAFDPVTAGTGTHILTYTYTDGNGCINSDNQNITVNEAPTADAGTNQTIPNGTNTPLDGSATGGSGTYSYSWSPADSVSDPAIEDPQTVNLYTTNVFTLTVTDDVTGCEDTSKVVITVEGGVLDVTASAVDAVICLGDSTQLNANGSGGSGSYTYSWSSNPPGFTSTTQNPWAEPSATTTYTVTVDDGFNTETDQIIIMVNSLPVVDLPDLSDVCIDASQFALSGGTPGGGIYSGTGVDGLGNFNPSVAGAGTHDIVYTYTDGNGCTNTDTSTQTVNDLPVVTLGVLDPVCVDETPFDLTQGSPSGGDYSGPGITTSPEFDPSVAGTGTHTITYTYTDGNNCTNTDNENITVNPLPNVNFIGLAADYCEDHVPVTLTGNQAPNGSFSGTGITDNADGTASFDPAVPAPDGTYDITYTYTNANGCTNTQTQQVTINSLPVVGFIGLNAAYCVDADSVLLTGSPLNGTWSGNGITDNGDGTAWFNPAAATVGGPYSITYSYTDGNTCENSYSQNVSVNATPTVVFMGLADDYCEGASSVTLNGNHAPGGTFTGDGITDYGDGTASFDPASVTPGSSFEITYSYTDGNGCSNTDTQTVIINALPDVSFTTLDDYYCLNADGVSLTGNQAPEGVFSGNGVIDNGDGTAVFNPTNAGVGGPYDVSYSFTDTNGCTNSQIQAVLVLDLPVVDFTGLEIDYCIDAPGDTLTGNFAPDGTFSGDGITDLGDGTAYFDPATAGIGGAYGIAYSYTDDSSCTNIATQYVTVNPLPDVSFTGLDSGYCVDAVAAILTGNHTGAGTFSGDGITDLGDGTAEFDPATAGVGGPYNIIYEYTDGNLCTNSDTQTVVVHDLPVVIFTGLQTGYCVDADQDTLTGNHAPEGEFSGTGITDNGNGTAIFNPGAAGSGGPYNITYTYMDSNSCRNEDIQLVMVYENPIITITDTFHVLCYGGNDGYAVAEASGGTPDYSYEWSSASTQDTAWNLNAGTYYITVTDDNGCTETDSVEILQPDTSIVLQTSTVNSNCGMEDGSATVIASGGTPPYTYLWENGDTEDTADSLGAGTHPVTVTDAHLCLDSVDVIVTDNGAGSLSFSNITDNPCFGDSLGQATVDITGGTAPFEYLWSNGDTAATADSLAAGVHYVTVTDDNGCITISDTTITEPTSLVSFTTDSSDISCNGLSDGIAIVTPSGGTPGYSYLWDNDPPDTDSTATGLFANIYYHVTITDLNGCTKTDSIILIEPDSLLSSITNTSDALCYGDSSGSATVTPSGGTPLYYYLWSGGQNITDSTVTGLAADVWYYVTITDENECIKIDSVTVSQPDPLALTGGSEDATCSATNGTAFVSVTGGTMPYACSWNTDPPQYSDTAIFLGAGSYTVTVTDYNLCTDTLTVVVSSTDGGTAYATPDHLTCYNDSTGSVTTVMDGGTPDYIYVWSTGDSTTTSDTAVLLSGLPAGIYYVTVTDQNGCISVDSAIVTQPDEIILSITHSDITCNGYNDGEISVITNGGTPTYEYSWSNGDTLPDIDGLTPGDYILVITDSNYCTKTDTITVAEPSPLLLTMINIFNANCYGSHDGSAEISAEGGTPPYNYLWSDSQTASTADSLPAGDYSVTVYDINNCLQTDSASITEPDEIIITDSIIDLNNIELNVTGGTLPYNYLWNNGESTDAIYNLLSGSYTVTVTDINDCEAYSTTDISVIDLVIPTAFTPNEDMTNDTWKIKKIESYSDVSVEVFNRWNQCIFNFSGTGSEYNDAAWDGTFNGHPAPMGSYVFIINLHDGQDPVTGVVSVVR